MSDFPGRPLGAARRALQRVSRGGAKVGRLDYEGAEIMLSVPSKTAKSRLRGSPGQ